MKLVGYGLLFFSSNLPLCLIMLFRKCITTAFKIPVSVKELLEPATFTNFCCSASAASQQQHNQDLGRIYYIEGVTISRINHFFPGRIAFNQSALRHFIPECIAP